MHIQYFGTHTIPGSSASEYIILRQKNLVVNRIPEKIPKNLLFFHFPAFWAFLGLFFLSARAKRGFNPAICVSKKGFNEIGRRSRLRQK